MIKSAIQKLLRREDLSEQEVMEVMNCIMDGNATQSQIGGFLTALRFKGETVEEITGCAKVMRDKAEKVQHSLPYCIDTCGTGGDGANTFNISTAASLIAAAAGVKVAKHGNRAMSSRSGSADVLEALGVNINLTPAQVGKCIEDVGIGFMFAQLFHKSMRHAAGVRKELGIRTVFNILGPLTNPANAGGQILGVYDGALTGVMAEVLRKLGSERAMVVHGYDGLDEISTAAPTMVAELKDGEIRKYTLDTVDLGIPRSDSQELKGGDAAQNADLVRQVLQGKRGAGRDIVLVNAAAALYVGKAADSLKEGLEIAAEMIDSGKTVKKLHDLCVYSMAIGKIGEVPA